MVIKQAQKNNRLGIIFFIILSAIIIMLLFLFFNKKETHLSEIIERDTTQAISCEKKIDKDSFFYDSAALEGTDKIKIIFYKDKPKKLFYSYIGKYNSEQTAKTHHAVQQSKYSEYFGSKEVSLKDIPSHFAHIDDEVTIDIYAESDKLNSEIGILFFIQATELKAYLEKTEEEVIKFYKDKSFTCQSTN